MLTLWPTGLRASVVILEHTNPRLGKVVCWGLSGQGQGFEGWEGWHVSKQCKRTPTAHHFMHPWDWLLMQHISKSINEQHLVIEAIEIHQEVTLQFQLRPANGAAFRTSDMTSVCFFYGWQFRKLQHDYHTENESHHGCETIKPI